jgi:hypothetical protein
MPVKGTYQNNSVSPQDLPVSLPIPCIMPLVKNINIKYKLHIVPGIEFLSRQTLGNMIYRCVVAMTNPNSR